MKKPLARTIVSAAVGLAACVAAAAPARAAMTPVTFGYSDWIGFAPLFVASEKKFFGDYPIKFVHMDSGINAALLSGAIDSADLSMNEIITDYVKGFPVKVVMAIDYSNGADAIIGSTAIKSVAELKGKTIPLDTASYSELLLSYALKEAKLTLTDVKQKDMPADDVPAALLGGHVKAGVTWAPNISMVTKNKKFHVLYASSQAPGLISDSFAVKEGFLKAHPKAIPAIIKGYLEGVAYIKAHPDKAYAIVGKKLGISPASAKEQYAQVVNPGLAEMKAMMTGKGESKVISYKTNIEMVSALMVYQKQLKPSQKVAWMSLIDTKYLDEVK